MLAARWRAHGVDVRLRTGVAHIRSDAAGRVSSILLTSGEELRADTALVGVGVTPAQELLPKRPAVHVHPAGDVVGPGHWTAAASDGAAAARAILGLPVRERQPEYVWSDQFGLRLQVVGTPSPDDTLDFEGGGDSFAVRYRSDDGAVRAALFANRPSHAGELRRHLAERAVALAA
jgi:3-phenylpropionate/trans-cinnamate dioxygenase ferredoxin reductase subunit